MDLVFAVFFAVFIAALAASIVSGSDFVGMPFGDPKHQQIGQVPVTEGFIVRQKELAKRSAIGAFVMAFIFVLGTFHNFNAWFGAALVGAFLGRVGVSAWLSVRDAYQETVEPRVSYGQMPTLGDYLPRWWLPAITTALVVVLTIEVLWVSSQGVDTSGALPYLVGGTLGTQCLSAAGVLWLARQPQRAISETDLYWSDRVRSDTIATGSIGGWAFSILIMSIAGSGPSLVPEIMIMGVVNLTVTTVLAAIALAGAKRRVEARWGDVSH